MEMLRIGGKTVSREKISRIVDRILELRKEGYSQQEAAEKVGVDRTFVSRLEKIGEVRRGRSIAVIGFPVANKDELESLMRQEGVDYWILLTDTERWGFVDEQSGQILFNKTMDLIARLRKYDIVLVIGSNYRIKLSQALLDKEVVGMEIGKSPIENEIYVNPEEVRALIRQLTIKDTVTEE